MRSAIAFVVILSFVVLSGCASEANTEIANPAAVYCEEQGHTSKIREYPSGGQIGICVNSDGDVCDEWKYYRGECKLE